SLTPSGTRVARQVPVKGGPEATVRGQSRAGTCDSRRAVWTRCWEPLCAIHLPRPGGCLPAYTRGQICPSDRSPDITRALEPISRIDCRSGSNKPRPPPATRRATTKCRPMSRPLDTYGTNGAKGFCPAVVRERRKDTELSRGLLR